MFMSRSTPVTHQDRLRGGRRAGRATPRAHGLAYAVLLVATLANVPARAEDSPYQVTVGAKLGVGGNFLGAPDDPPAGSPPFDDGVGGWGIGGGIFGEARFLNGHLGAEIGLLIDSSHNWSKLTIGNAIDYRLGWAATDLRLPVLINAGTSNEGTRLAFGTGPEFAFSLGADAKSEVTSGPDVPFPAFDAKGQTHVNWAFNAGLAVPLGRFRLTFDIRFAINLQSPNKYADRYELGTPPSVIAVHGMDLRFLLGFGYDLIR
jgi:hypothetical protein